jgi:predicted lipoprotein with Yx(FWY)xxD motif
MRGAEMDRTQRHGTWWAHLGRIAVTACAVGGLSAALLAASSAGAVTSRTATTIETAQNKQLGTILVSGNTVYTLKPSNTACGSKCLAIWPAVLLPQGVTAATAGSGVDASKLGTVPVSGGLQVTYAGKPLYWYAGDKAPGQVKGNLTDKWGKWSTVVTASPAGSGSTPTTSRSGGSNAGTGGTSF